MNARPSERSSRANCKKQARRTKNKA
jgi:hypothetical protein